MSLPPGSVGNKVGELWRAPSGGSFRHYNSLIFMRVKDVWPICFVVAEKPGSKKTLAFCARNSENRSV